MTKKEFKAESKRLLELMINSIYTNQEIFLRELISNASDALDKRHYLGITDASKMVPSSELTITIERRKNTRQLVIEDSGIGMNEEELERNLGTIAKSGSAEFRKQLDQGADNIDIIGQFGVGFYSAFMVAKQITVESLSANGTQAYRWVSSGEDGYTITECDKTDIGTRITIDMKDDTEDEKYSDYLEESRIKELIKKYSDYVRYPIQMEVTKFIPDPTDSSKTIDVKEMQTLNSMTPLWKRRKSEIKEEEYNDFYKSRFDDWEDPQKVIHYNVEGNISYTAMLFIPSKTPYNFYYQDYEPGLSLYCKGVFIMDKVTDLLPDHYRFVKGIIDSDDLNLNISREILQQDRQVKAMAKSIEKKIQSALEDMLEKDREGYESFFDNFGLNLKYGIYKDYGLSKEKLQDLILFCSSKDGEYVTLKEYTERMPEDQKSIYYACGSSAEDIERLPSIGKVKAKGYEVLYFMDERDEFVASIMQTYGDKPFQSVNKGDLDLDTEEEKKEKEEKTEANKDMLTALKDALSTKVKDVRISSRLTDDPVCVIADEGVSLEMEKFMSQDPNNRGLKAAKVLEINPDHPIFAKLQRIFTEDPETLKDYASILLDQALIIQGLPIEDPASYAKKITEILLKA